MIEWTGPKVQSIVCLFGGVVAMSKALNHPRHTMVSNWIDRKSIPAWRTRDIAEAAAREGIKLPKWFNGA